MKESVDAKTFISNATWGSLLFVSFASTNAQVMIHKRIFKKQKRSLMLHPQKWKEQPPQRFGQQTCKLVMDGQEGSTGL
jgi:hypothetical protein